MWISYFTLMTNEWVMSHVEHTWVVMSLCRWVVMSPCDTWMVHVTHVTYGWVVSRINESCHVWMSHVPYECVTSQRDETSRTNQPCHKWMRHVTYEWFMSHMNEPWQTCHIWMSHVTNILQGAMLHIVDMNEPCHTPPMCWFGLVFGDATAAVYHCAKSVCRYMYVNIYI